LGNLTSVVLADQLANARQRQALEKMLSNDPEAMPFAIFKSLTTNFLGVRFVPFQLNLEGVRSYVTVPGVLELQMAPMKNPVTGEDEPATLLKPKGFTSKQQELCSSAVLRLTSEGLSYDHSGKYAEFSRFEYKGP
jgi:hypothetical protein